MEYRRKEQLIIELNDLRIDVNGPASNDKQLNKQYQALATAIADLDARKRKVADESKQLLDAYRNGNSVDVRTSAEASAKANANRAKVKACDVESELLRQYPPLIDKAAAYESANQVAFYRERDIAGHMVDMAEELVRKNFERDYPARTWYAHPGALNDYVARHPVVLGAKDRLNQISTPIPDPTPANAQLKLRIMDALTSLLSQKRTAEEQAADAEKKGKALLVIENNRAAEVAANEKKRQSKLAETITEAKQRLALEVY